MLKGTYCSMTRCFDSDDLVRYISSFLTIGQIHDNRLVNKSVFFSCWKYHKLQLKVAFQYVYPSAALQFEFLDCSFGRAVVYCRDGDPKNYVKRQSSDPFGGGNYESLVFLDKSKENECFGLQGHGDNDCVEREYRDFNWELFSWNDLLEFKRRGSKNSSSTLDAAEEDIFGYSTIKGIPGYRGSLKGFTTSDIMHVFTLRAFIDHQSPNYGSRFATGVIMLRDSRIAAFTTATELWSWEAASRMKIYMGNSVMSIINYGLTFNERKYLNVTNSSDQSFFENVTFQEATPDIKAYMGQNKLYKQYDLKPAMWYFPFPDLYIGQDGNKLACELHDNRFWRKSDVEKYGERAMLTCYNCKERFEKVKELMRHGISKHGKRAFRGALEW